MHTENPSLLKSEATLHHMVPNEQCDCLHVKEVIQWVNMSQEDLFLEKSFMLVHVALQERLTGNSRHCARKTGWITVCSR